MGWPAGRTTRSLVVLASSRSFGTRNATTEKPPPSALPGWTSTCAWAAPGRATVAATRRPRRARAGWRYDEEKWCEASGSRFSGVVHVEGSGGTRRWTSAPGAARRACQAARRRAGRGGRRRTRPTATSRAEGRTATPAATYVLEPAGAGAEAAARQSTRRDSRAQRPVRARMVQAARSPAANQSPTATARGEVGAQHGQVGPTHHRQHDLVGRSRGDGDARAGLGESRGRHQHGGARAPRAPRARPTAAPGGPALARPAPARRHGTRTHVARASGRPGPVAASSTSTPDAGGAAPPTATCAGHSGEDHDGGQHRGAQTAQRRVLRHRSHHRALPSSVCTTNMPRRAWEILEPEGPFAG